jgi:phage shock protein E
MKTLFQALLLTILMTAAQAATVSFNGFKPAVIIDVRTAQEYAAGHIDGAIHIPHDQIGQGIQSVKGLKKTTPVLVYCRSGRRSGIAKSTLEQLGFKQIVNGGGIETVAQTLKTCSSKTC